MNGYLLDTHIILGWLADPKKLARPVREVIADGANHIQVSAAAAWEMAIKKALGRLVIPQNLAEVLAAEHMAVLPITLAHAMGVAELPVLHDDPFDRIQIVQARLEGLTFITRDRQIQQYDVTCLPA